MAVLGFGSGPCNAILPWFIMAVESHPAAVPRRPASTAMVHWGGGRAAACGGDCGHVRFDGRMGPIDHSKERGD